MKNTVMLSLTSEPDGSVTGNLCSLFEFKIATTRPADINAALSARGIRKFAFMGPISGVECSFPLTVRDLVSVMSLAEDAEQVLFIAGLKGTYAISAGQH
jgi:hypothetical protein